MRVLLTETDRGAAHAAVRELEAAGHEVLRCHPQGAPAFPCAGLPGEAGCPLHAPGGVDVAVTVRARPYPRPTAFEDGVACALRRRLPLVVAGNSALNPFERWTVATTDDHDVVAACEAAVRAPVADLSAAASAEAQGVLAVRSLPAEGVTVEVRRRARSLVVTLRRPAGAARADHDVAVRVLGVVRALDRNAATIDLLAEDLES